MKKQSTLFPIAVLGGDQRQVSMVCELADYGYPLHVWGIGEWEGIDDSNISVFRDWKAAVADASAVILPLPATFDGIRVNAPAVPENQGIRLDVLFHEIEGKCLLGGKLSEELTRHAGIFAIECIDYFNFEPLQLKNALPTAEGAISIAMRELSTTIDGTPMAIIGYGRIGELLAQKLSALGARITVYARREEVLTRAALAHLNVVKLDGDALCHMKKETRVVFNTVPECLFTARILPTLPKKCIFIDLAPAPGGIDHRVAEELQFKSIWATALPGKYAPESAGKYIAQTIVSILQERTHH